MDESTTICSLLNSVLRLDDCWDVFFWAKEAIPELRSVDDGARWTQTFGALSWSWRFPFLGSFTIFFQHISVNVLVNNLIFSQSI